MSLGLNFDAINLLITVTVVANAAYGLLVYNTNRYGAVNRTFFALTISISLWGLGMIAYRGLDNIEWATMAARFLYAAAALIPFYLIRFAWTFPNHELPRTFVRRWVLPTPMFLMIFLALIPGGLVLRVSPVEVGERIINFHIGTQIFYAAYITIYFIWVLLLLLFKTVRAHGENRLQLLYILLATLVPTLVGSITNLYLPFLGIYTLNWVGQISIVVTTTIVTYGMFKHRVFDARIIGTEILMFILWALSFSDIVFANDSRGVITATIVFVR